MRGLGNKECGEQLAERRIVPAPILPHQRPYSCTSSDFVRVSTGTPALRISSTQDEMRPAVGMLARAGGGDSRALGNPKRREPEKRGTTPDPFQIQQHRLKRQITHL